MSLTEIGTNPADIEYRMATQRDLAAAARIHAAGDQEQMSRLHPLSSAVPFDKAARTRSARLGLESLYDEDPRQVWVATLLGRIIGVCSAVFRDRHAHIQSFFITPKWQQRGVGGELLRRLHRAGQEAGCSHFSLQASDDPRALGLYLRLGLRVQAPNIVWASTRPVFPRPRFDDPFEQVPLDVADEAALNTVSDIDKAVRGARRQQDLLRWLEEPGNGSLLFDRETGTPAGYFVVSAESAAGRIGPVAAMDLSRFGGVFHSALVAAGKEHSPGRVWRLAVPGENQAAIAPLLDARFRPLFTMNFLATEAIGRFDRYVLHDLDYL